MLTTIAIIVLIITVANRHFHIFHLPVPPQTPTVLSDQSGPTTTPANTTTPSPNPATPTSHPSSTPTPVPTGRPVASSLSLVYPNSTKISDNTYTTPDSAQSVVDWYKSQIENNHFNIKTVVNTTTNGNTKAVIKAVGSSGQVDITITRGASDSVTEIETK